MRSQKYRINGDKNNFIRRDGINFIVKFNFAVAA